MLLGEMADSEAGAGSKEVLEKLRKIERGAGKGRGENKKRGREEKGRKKKKKQKPDSSYLSQEMKVNIRSSVRLMAVTLDHL